MSAHWVSNQACGLDFALLRKTIKDVPIVLSS